MSTPSISLEELLAEMERCAPAARPENSVTPEEMAARLGLSRCYCREMLERNPKLKRAEFRTAAHKRAICYVPV